ncbi:hypothetical protein BDN67DRAFT_1015822 [Paxillus ammoniavirescens]|nr:hypothetical protein BDN67DRAFT_1015822 [Paxillus ammoniavirescens]
MATIQMQTPTETMRDDANSSEQSTGATREEPYTQDEINVLRKRELLKLVKRQPEKWPRKYIKLAQLTVDTLKSSLLDPGCGFTKTVLYDVAADEGNGTVHGGEGDVVNMAEDAELQLEHCDDRDGGGLSPDGQECSIDEMGDNRRSVQIFINNCRPTAANPQTSCGVRLTEVSHEGCGENQWHVGMGELLQQLQRSSGVIEGTSPFRLAYPDPLNEAYSRCFLRMQPGQQILKSTPDLAVLAITDDGGGNHFISLTVQQPQVTRSAVPSTAVQPSPSGSRAGTSLVVTAERAEALSKQTQWLKAEALKCPDYNTFSTAQHRSVTNAEIVASWRFAADFVSAYNKTSSDRMGVHGAFNKKVIQEALGIRATWLSEAETSAALVNKYGLGGTQPNQAVIRMLESRERTGRKALLGFLKGI